MPLGAHTTKTLAVLLLSFSATGLLFGCKPDLDCTDGACPDGYSCFEKRCRLYCNDSRTCPDDQWCRKGMCLPRKALDASIGDGRAHDVPPNDIYLPDLSTATDQSAADTAHMGNDRQHFDRHPNNDTAVPDTTSSADTGHEDSGPEDKRQEDAGPEDTGHDAGIVDPDLRVHYTFDNIVGSTVYNSVADTNHGTIHGAFGIQGVLDNALFFGGVEDHVDLQFIEFGGTELTIAAWIYATDLHQKCQQGEPVSSQGRIFSQARNASDQEHFVMLSVWCQPVPTLRFRLKTDGVTQTLIPDSTTLPQNEWVHVAAVYNGSLMFIYQEGIEIAIRQNTGDITQATPQAPAWLGGNPPIPTERPWHGGIDDFRIYDRALTGGEIQALSAP